MARQLKPPRLLLRRERSGLRYWAIRDHGRTVATGCLEADLNGADRALTTYKAEQYEPVGENHPSRVSVIDVLLLYARIKGPAAKRPAEFCARLERLSAYWGGKKVADIRGATCRDFAAKRGARIAAREDLSTLRAAVNLYHAEHTLTSVPVVTLPPRNPPRQRWLTRSEAARLLAACLGWERALGHNSGEPLLDANGREIWRRRRDQKRAHHARLVLIGLYTGTRPGAILSLRWRPNTQGGWVDLDRGVMHRLAEDEAETKKRKPPTRIPPRLLAHLRRWRTADDAFMATLPPERRPSAPPIVHYRGASSAKINKGFRSARDAAGLDKDVTPHILRHTRATWLMQSGKVDIYEAAGSLGMTVQILEDVYGHHHPDFQKDAANAY